MPGFFLLVGTRSKTFKGDLWENGKRETIRVKVGEVARSQLERRERKRRCSWGPLLTASIRGPGRKSLWVPVRMDPTPPEAGVGALS